jgi:hypothetical protein
MNHIHLFLKDKREIIEKLNEYKLEKDGHWLWLGTKIKDGYGHLGIQGKLYLVHRLSMYCYKDFDINSNLCVLHINECHTPSCFNPDHLYIGPHGANMEDISKLVQLTPNYPCGHPRTARNTSTQKTCRECHRIRSYNNYRRRIKNGIKK